MIGFAKVPVPVNSLLKFTVKGFCEGLVNSNDKIIDVLHDREIALLAEYKEDNELRNSQAEQI